MAGTGPAKIVVLQASRPASFVQKNFRAIPRISSSPPADLPPYTAQYMLLSTKGASMDVDTDALAPGGFWTIHKGHSPKNPKYNSSRKNSIYDAVAVFSPKAGVTGSIRGAQRRQADHREAHPVGRALKSGTFCFF